MNVRTSHLRGIYQTFSPQEPERRLSGTEGSLLLVSAGTYRALRPIAGFATCVGVVASPFVPQFDSMYSLVEVYFQSFSISKFIRFRSALRGKVKLNSTAGVGRWLY